ncbi:MAG TPA: molybdenum cofactor guanylyltransferase MobA [Methylovirgula sp.]|nr:molybdenum cofactor guanylyltransferase MobA [Methylovirgula sp.]
MSAASSLPSTFGILLAGGRATRMGGNDKALIELCGAPLLARVIAAVEPQCEGLLISANGDLARFETFGFASVRDEIEGFAGPLAGILAGLDFIAQNRPEVGFALSVPTDTPFLPADLAARLSAAQDDGGIVCARSGGATHPVVALWPVAIRGDLRRALIEERIRKVDHFISRHRRAYADWPIEPFDPFFNINAPQDLSTAEAILARVGDPLQKRTPIRHG